MTENLSSTEHVDELTVAYGTHRQQDAIVNFPPAAAWPAPLVLFFHGGFWREKWDREYLRGPLAELAAQGYVVANIEYRRVSGDGGWPNTLIDAATATDTLPGLIESARPGSVNPALVITVGHSAGGHLALWTSLRDQIPAGSPGFVEIAPAIAGVITLAGAVDLTEADRLGEGAGAVGEFLGGSPTDFPDRYAAADPAIIGTPTAPVVIIHGEKDDVLHVEMSRAYASKFGASMIEIPGGGHLEVVEPGSTSWQSFLDALREIVTSR